MILVKSGCEVITKNDDNALLFSIERAGRTCYKSESKITKDSAIEFIKKIIKNGHHSVLEHENIQVRIVCDRGVSHEIVRHRLAAYSQECLTGDTEVRKGLTIKQLYDRQSNCYGATHNRTIHLRSVNINGNIIPNKMVEVRYKGQAEVYEVITKLGYKIRTTLNHEFQLPTKEFDILKNIVVGDKVMVNGRPKLYTFIENELEDLYLNQKLSPLEISQKTGCSYRYVLTELKNLGIFVCKLNDKNLEKYSKNHNQESVEKMRNTILKQYENGRLIWNRGMTGENSH
jgi:AraC-like DNA-binding protein